MLPYHMALLWSAAVRWFRSYKHVAALRPEPQHLSRPEPQHVKQHTLTPLLSIGRALLTTRSADTYHLLRFSGAVV
jgi:hypothetical protein